jgi:hypothetical protein
MAKKTVKKPVFIFTKLYMFVAKSLRRTLFGEREIKGYI